MAKRDKSGDLLNSICVERMESIPGVVPFDCVAVWTGQPLLLIDERTEETVLALPTNLPIYIPIQMLPAYLADLVFTLEGAAAKSTILLDDIVAADIARETLLAEALVFEAERRVQVEQLLKEVDGIGYEGDDKWGSLSELADRPGWREAVAHAITCERAGVPATYGEDVARVLVGLVKPDLQVALEDSPLWVVMLPPDDDPLF